MSVTPLAGGVLPRIGIRHTILLSVATSALGVLLTLVHPVWGIVAALAIAACGTFVTQSATMSFIAYRITSGRSLASGLYYAAYYCGGFAGAWACRSEEHTSELQSLMRISYAVFCLKKKQNNN